MKEDAENLLDVVLHPVRMRLLVILAGRKMTPREIAEELGDIPQATLYRHLGRLSEAGMLAVVEERPVRGTVEKVYALSEQGGRLRPDQLAAIGAEEHMRYFTIFVASLLDDFSRYLNSATRPDFLADGAAYYKFPLELSDEELAAMRKAIDAAILPYAENAPAPDRKRRIMATVVVPDRRSGARSDSGAPDGRTAATDTTSKEETP